MRFLFFSLLVALSSCSASRKLNNSSDLVLIDAYFKYSVGGREQEDNSNAILHYFFLFEENNQVKFTAIEINKVAYEFESFNYEGKLYLVAKSFYKSEEFKSKSYNGLEGQEAVINYEIMQEKKVLIVDEIEMSEPSSGD